MFVCLFVCLFTCLLVCLSVCWLVRYCQLSNFVLQGLFTASSVNFSLSGVQQMECRPRVQPGICYQYGLMHHPLCLVRVLTWLKECVWWRTWTLWCPGTVRHRPTETVLLSDQCENDHKSSITKPTPNIQRFIRVEELVCLKTDIFNISSNILVVMSHIVLWIDTKVYNQKQRSPYNTDISHQILPDLSCFTFILQLYTLTVWQLLTHFSPFFRLGILGVD